jgi:ABC-type sugar transport system permease subunit
MGAFSGKVVLTSRMKSKVYERLKPYLYILPAFFFLFVFTYYPIFRAIYISFFNWSTDYPIMVFNGVQNYFDVLKDGVFQKVIGNTILYSISTIFLSMSIGLLLAVQVYKKLKLGGLFKVALFYPMMIPGAAAALIWLWMFLPTYGLLDHLLAKIGIRGFPWLTSTKTALWCIVLVGVWKHVGYYMILFLAGLTNIPNELTDAARVEGASSWTKFWRITFPLLSSYTFFIFIINIVDSLQSIDLVYIMTKGGPANSTNLIVYHIYQQAFRYWNMGVGSTLTSMLTLFLLGCVVVIFSTIGRKVYYEA